MTPAKGFRRGSAFRRGSEHVEAMRSAPWRAEAIGAASVACTWAAGHEGRTCIQATDAAAYWCLSCKTEWNRRAPS